MGVYYRVWRDEDKAAGKLAYHQCLALPVEWMSNSEALLDKSAESEPCIRYRLQMPGSPHALQSGAVLLHKDRQFEPLPVIQELLPLKARRIVK